MINKYYGVASTPTSDYLVHYGIKGMKWGVRKAIANGGGRALSRQYKKAEKKLAKLEDKANKNHQQNIVNAARRDQRISAGVGAASTGAAALRTIGSIKQAIKTGSGYANVYLPVGAGVAAGSIIANSIRKRRAQKNLSESGHRKAVNEANAFRKEMKTAFKGTEYANKVGQRAKELSRKHEDRTAKYLKRSDRFAYAERKSAAEKSSSKIQKRKRRG